MNSTLGHQGRAATVHPLGLDDCPWKQTQVCGRGFVCGANRELSNRIGQNSERAEVFNAPKAYGDGAAPVVTLLLASLLVAGCGSSGSSTSTETTVAITKAEFVKQGNAICVAGEKAQEAEAEAFFNAKGLKNRNEQPTKAQKDEVAETVFVPNIQKQIGPESSRNPERRGTAGELGPGSLPTGPEQDQGEPRTVLRQSKRLPRCRPTASCGRSHEVRGKHLSRAVPPKAGGRPPADTPDRRY